MWQFCLSKNILTQLSFINFSFMPKNMRAICWCKLTIWNQCGMMLFSDYFICIFSFVFYQSYFFTFSWTIFIFNFLGFPLPFLIQWLTCSCHFSFRFFSLLRVFYFSIIFQYIIGSGSIVIFNCCKMFVLTLAFMICIHCVLLIMICLCFCRTVTQLVIFSHPSIILLFYCLLFLFYVGIDIQKRTKEITYIGPPKSVLFWKV